MAAPLDKFLTCDTQGMSLEAIVRSLMVTDADGNKGFRVVIKQAACDTLTDVDCGFMPSTEQGFRERIVLDDCGKPALLLISSVAP